MAPKSSLTLLLMGVLLSSSSYAARLHMRINKEVVLSPGHPVMPYLITRALNGDFIVAGSTGFQDFWPWVTRVSSSGAVLWEYINGSSNGWTDHSVKNQRFYGAVDLPNQNILLCGLKQIGNHQTAVTVLLHGDGTLIEERPLQLERPGRPTGIVCTRWGDGVAVLGTLPGIPAATGWLVKLNMGGQVMWEKFADYFGYGDVMEASEGGLFLVWRSSVSKVSQAGELVESYPLGDGEWELVHPTSPKSNVRVAGMLSTLQTEVIDFDETLKRPTHIQKLANAGIKKALGLSDGSVAIFGSQFLREATASIAVLGKDGVSNSFLINPPYKSGWFFDAAPADAETEFAAVRSVGANATLSLISIQ